MVKFLSCKDTAREIARRVARASPKLGSHEDRADLGTSFDDNPRVNLVGVISLKNMVKSYILLVLDLSDCLQNPPFQCCN
jgi:hypothetical protein